MSFEPADHKAEDGVRPLFGCALLTDERWLRLCPGRRPFCARRALFLRARKTRLERRLEVDGGPVAHLAFGQKGQRGNPRKGPNGG